MNPLIYILLGIFMIRAGTGKGKKKSRNYWGWNRPGHSWGGYKW